MSQERAWDCFPSLRRLMEETDNNQGVHASAGKITGQTVICVRKKGNGLLGK